MSKSLISVILPVYNVADYIEKCIHSLLSQTYQNFELILIDDCSPDNSIELAVAFFGKHQFKDYQVIKHTLNGGAAVARNTGMAAASGEYVYFMDNDDYAETTLFEEMIKPFSDPAIDIVVCNFWTATMETGKKEVGFQSPLHGKVDSFTALQALMEEKEHSYVWRNLFRKKVLQNIKFAEKVVFEDVMTTALIWANAGSLCFISHFLYNYVQRKGSVTTNWRRFEWFHHLTDYMSRNEQYFQTHKQLKPLYKKMLILHYSMVRNFSLQIAQGDNAFSFYDEQLNRYRSHIKLSALLQFSQPKNLQLVYQLLILKISTRFFWKKYRTASAG